MKIWALSILSILFLSTFSITTYSSALPQKQIRHAINYLDNTPTGREVLSQFNVNNQYAKLYNITQFGTLPVLYSVTLNRGDQIILNNNLMAASPKYVAWVLSQALQTFKIKKYAARHSVYKLPRYYEISIWSMAYASQIWAELGSPNKEDYALDQRHGWLARKSHSSSSRYDRLWKKDRQTFFKKVITRHFHNGLPDKYLTEAVKRSKGHKKVTLKNILKTYNQFKNQHLD